MAEDANQDNAIELKDEVFSVNTQLDALVQLRIHQDNVFYNRVNVLLISQSMLILAFVETFRDGLAPGVAAVGLFVSVALGFTLLRQNRVLDYNIRHLSHIWDVSRRLEEQIGLSLEQQQQLKIDKGQEQGESKMRFRDLFTHARPLLSVLLPCVFGLMWLTALLALLYK